MRPEDEFAALRARAAGDPHVLGVVLSGSQAREGAATSRSDHDVLLVVDDAGETSAARRRGQIALEGSLTSGELAGRTGLTTGATTRLIGRLEKAGYVRRTAGPPDRRTAGPPDRRPRRPTPGRGRTCSGRGRRRSPGGRGRPGPRFP
ncbi:MarR family transcriptional regulator [Streptomyces bathyalis]|uniref:MarR family transcriptional regulator n=1 Tax=Streptomyces bathyalis TaxID=2710756 RepID=A0A7T1T9I5_9ACTN|nr:MarR family transcriptional regulator [Streptomyces bathyalis]